MKAIKRKGGGNEPPPKRNKVAYKAESYHTRIYLYARMKELVCVGQTQSFIPDSEGSNGECLCLDWISNNYDGFTTDMNRYKPDSLYDGKLGNVPFEIKTISGRDKKFFTSFNQIKYIADPNNRQTIMGSWFFIEPTGKIYTTTGDTIKKWWNKDLRVSEWPHFSI